MDDGVRGHVVEVVESTGHINCDGDDVFQRKMLSWTSVDYRALRLVGMNSVRIAIPPSSLAPRKRSKLG